MDEKKIAAVLAKGEDAALRGYADMWRNAVADAVLILLEETGEVTRETLRQALEARANDTGISKFKRAELQGALNALAGRPPRD